MRHGVIVALAGALVLAGAALVVVRSSDDPDVAPNAAGLAARTVAAGQVEVEIEPVRLDDRGALFAITLDTHSTELDVDLTRAALVVGGETWPVDAWSGDGPGGHHREGGLSFRPGSPATGTATLSIPGLPEPVDTTWELGT